MFRHLGPAVVDGDNGHLDEANGNDVPNVGPSANHPSTMAVELLSTDVVDGEGESEEGTDDNKAEGHCEGHLSTHGGVSEHSSTSIAKESENDADVAGNAVIPDEPVADARDELEGSEKAGGKVASEMKCDADLVSVEVANIVARGRKSGRTVALREFRAHLVVDVEPVQSGESESEETATPDDPFRQEAVSLVVSRWRHAMQCTVTQQTMQRSQARV